ncbi:MAG: DMT family transporter [Clostridia bacterium]|nr:DMT family transporter [Clostridia bacterium]
MDKQKKLNVIGQLCLLAAITVWGSSFVILKETIKTVPSLFVIAVRFLLSTAVLSLVFIKKVRAMRLKTFLHGALIGLVLSFAYFFQTKGLENTTPARNAFLTSSYCVMCPFIIWGMFKKKPKLKNLIAAVMAIVGIGFVALSGDSGTGENTLLGDGLTIICAVFYALQIVFIDHFQKNGEDGIQLLIPELLVVGVVFAVATLAFELPVCGIQGYALNLDQLLKIGYLTFFCTLFAQGVQIIGQKYTTSAQSSIILSGEAVFGVLFSVIVGYESLSIWLIVGFIILFVAMIITELDGVSFGKNKKLGGDISPKNKGE